MDSQHQNLNVKVVCISYNLPTNTETGIDLTSMRQKGEGVWILESKLNYQKRTWDPNKIREK